MQLISDIDEMRAFSARERDAGRSVVLVPTMGSLHRGHLELIQEGVKHGETVVVSIFVNPTQFGESEDFATYPRELTSDMEKAQEAGADVIFHPDGASLYPEGFKTFVEVNSLGDRLCGRSRPGHFRGVTTIVAKLLNICRPETAIFGLKDYQQFVIIRRMVRDLDMGVCIVGVETVRETDGLALSSRNAYLSHVERSAAVVVPASLELARKLFKEGCKKSEEILEEVKKNIEKEELAVIDYLMICDPDDLSEIDSVEPGSLLAVAIKIGKTRLIDNTILS